MSQDRTVLKLVEVSERTYTHVHIGFEDIKKGMLLRLIEPDGKDLGVFEALSDAYLNDQSMWCFDTLESRGL